jgi:hypothetical protein
LITFSLSSILTFNFIISKNKQFQNNKNYLYLILQAFFNRYGH